MSKNKLGVDFSCQDQQVEGAVAEFKILSNKLVPFNNKGVIYFHLFNRSPDMGETEHLLFMAELFAQFNYMMWPLQARPTRDPKKAYFKMYFVDEDLKARDKEGKVLLKCPYPIRRSTLAVQYANYATRGRRKNWSGYCFFNDTFYLQLKDDPKVDAKDIRKISQHEVIGHGLGLNHTKVKGELMQASYNPLNDWTIDSIQGLNSLYGDLRIRMLKSLEGPAEFYKLIMDEVSIDGLDLIAEAKKKSKGSGKKSVVRGGLG